MQIDIQGHNTEVSEALETLTRQKLNRIASHLSSITSIDIIFRVNKHEHRAEGQILFPKHKIFAHATDTDMYKSLDQLIHKLAAQIDRFKDKIKDHHD